MLNDCRRADLDPTRKDRLCSCHFLNGNKTLGRTIFVWNKKGTWTFATPQQTKRKRKAGKENVAPVLPLSIEIMQSEQPNPSISSTKSSALDSAEMFFLREENETFKQQLKERQKRFSFKDKSSDDNLVFKYSGLPTAAHVLMLSRFTYYCGWKVEILSHVDQLFSTKELAWRGNEGAYSKTDFFKIETSNFGKPTGRIEYNPLFSKTAQGGINVVPTVSGCQYKGRLYLSSQVVPYNSEETSKTFNH
ncbi:hypothetical protein FQR65_LT10035 [Abscondita terminalis]|nr:hypothetical protein FQR65_LT10035 [Abscondita terminalis]